MIADITCATCGQIMGQVEKEEITQADQDMYRQMMTCDLGHHAGALDVIEETAPEDVV